MCSLLPARIVIMGLTSPSILFGSASLRLQYQDSLPFNRLDLRLYTVISNLLGLYSWIDGLHMSSNRKDILEVVCGVTLWSLWNFRNEVIFGSVQPIRSMLFDKIVDFSFRWFSSRSKSSSISWNNWIQNPLVVYSL
ncbi:hypothetical protein Tco_0778116 [Tanacetum coccineum]